MLMSYLWCGMVLCSVLCAVVLGNESDLAQATLGGASSAVELCLAMAGGICLWSGVMEILRQSGLSRGLSRILRPVLKRLYPKQAEQEEAMGAISANMTANLLGLGNAATPLGIQAAKALRQGERESGEASHALCLLVVCNTASIQLMPSTVLALRNATGSENASQILPAVWLCSLASITVGIATCQILGRLWEKREGRRGSGIPPKNQRRGR